MHEKKIETQPVEKVSKLIRIEKELVTQVNMHIARESKGGNFSWFVSEAVSEKLARLKGGKPIE